MKTDLIRRALNSITGSIRTLVVISDDPFVASKSALIDFGTSSLHVRLPQHLSAFEVRELLSSSIARNVDRLVYLHIPDAAARSTDFLSTVLRNVVETETLRLILGVRANELNNLRPVANLVSLFLEDTTVELPDVAPREVGAIIASSSVDLVVARLRSLGATDGELLECALLPQLKIREFKIEQSGNRSSGSEPQTKRDDGAQRSGDVAGKSEGERDSSNEEVFLPQNVEPLNGHRQPKPPIYKTTQREHSRSKGSKSASHGRPGRVVQGNRARGTSRISLYQTLAVALPWQPSRKARSNDTARSILLEMDDLRSVTITASPVQLTILVIDSSGSMSAASRIRSAKGFAMQALSRSYQERNYVGVICARGKRAEVIVHPTRGVAAAARGLFAMPTGGATPLASGLEEAVLMAHAFRSRQRFAQVRILLFTDGKANQTLRTGANIREELESLSQLVSEEKIEFTIVAASEKSVNNHVDSLAKTLRATVQYVKVHSRNRVHD
jgi:Mg-chelatase subunit ChlD